MKYKADNTRNFSDKAIYRELNNLLKRFSIYIKINEQFSETNLILLGLFFIHDTNKDVFYNILRNGIYNNQGELVSIVIDDTLNIYKNILQTSEKNINLLFTFIPYVSIIICLVKLHYYKE